MTAAKSNGASAEMVVDFTESNALAIGLLPSMIAGPVANRKACVREPPTRKGYISMLFSPDRYASGSLEKAIRQPGAQK